MDTVIDLIIEDIHDRNYDDAIARIRAMGLRSAADVLAIEESWLRAKEQEQDQAFAVDLVLANLESVITPERRAALLDGSANPGQPVQS